MRRNLFVTFSVLSLFVTVLTGCTELFVFAGPGGVFGPTNTTGGTTGSVNTAATNTISAPGYTQSRVDPTLEATAGAKVIVPFDMDGDGLLDLVSGSNESQPIQLHMRTGAAVAFDTFSIAGGGPIARMIDLEIADFDGDGNPDIAVLVRDTGIVPVDGASIRGAVVIVFAPDDPTDQLGWTQVIVGTTFTLPGEGDGFTAFAVEDFNNDGRADIALGTNEVDDADLIRFYSNPGGTSARDSGSWTESTMPLTRDVNVIRDLKAGDVDGDGDMDIVATFPTAATYNIRWIVNPMQPAGNAAVMAGDWEVRIVGQQAEAEPDNQGGDAISIGDIDDDGDLDVAVAHAGLRLIQWFENPGDPFIAQQTFPWRVYNLGQLVEGVTINQLQLVDLNLDGSLDVFATASGNMVGFQRGVEVRDFWSGFSILATNPVADIGRTSFADVNADGRLDIITPFDREGLSQDQFLIFLRTTP